MYFIFFISVSMFVVLNVVSFKVSSFKAAMDYCASR